jgi:TatD DNase family protein
MSEGPRDLNFIDTHCHLDDPQFADDLSETLARAIDSGVSQFVNVGFSPERWHSSIQLSQSVPSIHLALGLHPHHASEWSPLIRRKLRELLIATRAVALGEVGLDYFRNRSDATHQRQALLDQVELADELKLPLIVHLRGEIEKDVMEILASPPGVPVVFHSFEGSEQLADFAVERGFYFGIGGLATRQKQLRLPMLIQRLPRQSLLLETDSPYLRPKSWRGSRNEPGSLPIIAEWLAQLLGIEVDGIGELTSSNAWACFPSIKANEVPSMIGKAAP